MQHNYKLIGEYVNTHTACLCKCLKCNIEKNIIPHQITQCKNCMDLEIIKTFKSQNCVLLDTPKRGGKMQYVCSCGNTSAIRWFNFKKGERCRKCMVSKNRENNAKRLRVMQTIHQEFEKEGCKLLEKNYFNQSTPMQYICSCGNKSAITWKIFKKGHRCHKCAKIKIANRFIPSGEAHSNWNPDRKEVLLNKKIRSKIKHALRNTLREIKKLKVIKTFETVGYTKHELTQHIINHVNWKTLKDTDDWEIDHYFPIKAFVNYNVYDEKAINALSNLRPLSKIENRIKNCTYDKREFEKYLVENKIEFISQQ